MICTTCEEVFLEAARVAKMIEGTSVLLGHCVKYDDGPIGEACSFISFISRPANYKFAIALLEGKPVFAGDILYSKFTDKEWIATTQVLRVNPHSFSLTPPPPKPKTFMLNGVEYALPDVGADITNVCVWLCIYGRYFYWKDIRAGVAATSAIEALLSGDN